MRILLDSRRELCYSLSPTCGTAIIRFHQPCTKLLRSRVTVDYPDRTAIVMPNEPSNHKAPSFPAVSWTNEATIISLFSLIFLSWRKPPLASLLPHLVPHFTLFSYLPVLDGRWSTGRCDVYDSGQNHRGSWYNFLGDLACDFYVPNDSSKFLFWPKHARGWHWFLIDYFQLLPLSQISCLRCV